MADTKTYQTSQATPPPRATAVLRILYGLERGKRFELVGTEFTIGRGEKADIVLAGPTIAEIHAILYVLPSSARLRDAGSAAGLRVNGRIVDNEISLSDGAQIEIGGVVLAFVYKPVAEASDDAPQEESSDPPPPLPPGPPRANPDEPAWAHLEPKAAPPIDKSGAPEPQDMTFTAAEGGGPSVRVDTGEKQVRQFSLRGRGIGRIRIGSQRPLVTQLVSWFVILTVVLSAGWVFQTVVYDSVKIPEISSPAVAGSAQDEGPIARTEKTKVSGDRGEPSDPSFGYGMAYVPSSAEPPDKARRTFDQAMSDYWNDDNDSALTGLKTLSRDHPDFTPPIGDSVAQLIEKMETQIRYSDAVSRAVTLAATQTTTGIELKEALAGLAEIPPTDSRFGSVASLYRQSLQAKMRELGEDTEVGAPDADDADDDDDFGDDATTDDDDDDADDADDDDDTDDFGDMDDDLADMALDEDGEVVEERLHDDLDGRTLLSQAKEEAQRLYQEGRYKDAARIYGLLRQEDGLTRRQRDKCLYLERKLLHFGLVMDEGLELVGDPATTRQGIRRLESALATDRILFRFYQRLLRKEISDAHAVLARDALGRGDLVQAGEHVELGLARDATRPVWGSLKPEIAAAAMEHLDRARAGLEVEPARAKRILKQVVAAAPEGSPAFEEASVLLEALDIGGTKPTLPAEATF